MSVGFLGPVRTAVLISGRGSNLEALLQASREPGYPARILTVLSNREDAGGLETARRSGVNAVALPHRLYPDREAHERAIDAVLREAGVELVALAGYMRVLTPWLVDRWRGRMLNIHPSLLPAYAGLDTHARVLAAGERRHGCSVHLVSEGVDEGRVLGQAAIDVLPGDDPEALALRVLREEHRLYPRVLAEYARAIRAGEA